jgi:hypothetical protein
VPTVSEYDLYIQKNNYGYSYLFHVRDKDGDFISISVRRDLSKPISADARDAEAEAIAKAIKEALA